MKCPKCGCVFEVEDDELKLAKKILSLALKGKKEEIKKLCKRRIDFVGANFPEQLPNLQMRRLKRKNRASKEETIKKVWEIIPKKERDFIKEIAKKDKRHNEFIEKILLDVGEPIIAGLDIYDLRAILISCDSYHLIDGTKIPEELKRGLKGIIIRMEMPVKTTIDDISKIGEKVIDGVGDDVNVIWCARISETLKKPKIETFLVR